MQELGRYDQPALWNYVLNHTGESKLIYCGHSQGTSQMFIAMSEQPDFFRSRCALAIMLAPVARVDNMSSTILQKMKENDTAVSIATKIGPELLPNPNVEGKVAAGFFKLTAGFGISLVSDDDSDACSKKGL